MSPKLEELILMGAARFDARTYIAGTNTYDITDDEIAVVTGFTFCGATNQGNAGSNTEAMDRSVYQVEFTGGTTHIYKWWMRADLTAASVPVATDPDGYVIMAGGSTHVPCYCTFRKPFKIRMGVVPTPGQWGLLTTGAPSAQEENQPTGYPPASVVIQRVTGIGDAEQSFLPDPAITAVGPLNFNSNDARIVYGANPGPPANDTTLAQPDFNVKGSWSFPIVNLNVVVINTNQAGEFLPASMLKKS